MESSIQNLKSTSRLDSLGLQKFLGEVPMVERHNCNDLFRLVSFLLVAILLILTAFLSLAFSKFLCFFVLHPLWLLLLHFTIVVVVQAMEDVGNNCAIRVCEKLLIQRHLEIRILGEVFEVDS